MNKIFTLMSLFLVLSSKSTLPSAQAKEKNEPKLNATIQIPTLDAIQFECFTRLGAPLKKTVGATIVELTECHEQEQKFIVLINSKEYEHSPDNRYHEDLRDAQERIFHINQLLATLAAWKKYDEQAQQAFKQFGELVKEKDKEIQQLKEQLHASNKNK